MQNVKTITCVSCQCLESWIDSKCNFISYKSFHKKVSYANDGRNPEQSRQTRLIYSTQTDHICTLFLIKKLGIYRSGCLFPLWLRVIYYIIYFYNICWLVLQMVLLCEEHHFKTTLPLASSKYNFAFRSIPDLVFLLREPCSNLPVHCLFHFQRDIPQNHTLMQKDCLNFLKMESRWPKYFQ